MWSTPGKIKILVLISSLLPEINMQWAQKYFKAVSLGPRSMGSLHCGIPPYVPVTVSNMACLLLLLFFTLGSKDPEG